MHTKKRSQIYSDKWKYLDPFFGTNLFFGFVGEGAPRILACVSRWL